MKNLWDILESCKKTVHRIHDDHLVFELGLNFPMTATRITTYLILSAIFEGVIIK